MASARTSDHHPIPMQPTRRGPALTTFSLLRAEIAVCGLVSDDATRLLFPAHGRRHDLLGAVMGEALALGDIHSKNPARIPAKSPALRRIGGLCASVSPSSSHFH